MQSHSLKLLVDGNTIYYGQASEAVDYFSSLGLKCGRFYNPAGRFRRQKKCQTYHKLITFFSFAFSDFMMGLILQEELRKGTAMKQRLIQAWDDKEEDEKQDHSRSSSEGKR